MVEGGVRTQYGIFHNWFYFFLNPSLKIGIQYNPSTAWFHMRIQWQWRLANTYLEPIENHPGGYTKLYSLLTLIVVFWLFLNLLRYGSNFIVIQSLYRHPPLANTFSEIISDLLFDFSFSFIIFQDSWPYDAWYY